MKKIISVVAAVALFTLANCGSSGTSTPTAAPGLASCTAVAGSALVCGTVTASDGTPIVSADIKNVTGGSSSEMTGYYASVSKSTISSCLTDANGAFACALSTGGAYDFSITATGMSKTFSATLTADATTSVAASLTTLSGSDITAKWLVIMGSWDGVQLLLSQIKGCTLTGDSAHPESMTASAACTAVNLDVQAASEVATTFSALANLTPYSAIFINCGTDISAYATVVQQYVAAGGHIYFSDLSDPGVTAAFPNKVTYDASASTSTGTAVSTVNYANLATYLGTSTINVEFDLIGWTAIDSVASGVTTYIKGDTSAIGGKVDAPLTVGWKQGTGGCVFYTSYHIEGASTGSNQEKALKYLILNISSVCQ
jgi:hypothetical protein